MIQKSSFFILKLEKLIITFDNHIKSQNCVSWLILLESKFLIARNSKIIFKTKTLVLEFLPNTLMTGRPADLQVRRVARSDTALGKEIRKEKKEKSSQRFWVPTKENDDLVRVKLDLLVRSVKWEKEFINN